MPRIYIRKTNRQNWPEEQMQKALDAVKDGMPYKTASREFKVPVMALKRRAKGKNKIAVGSAKKLGSKQTVFNQEQEQELVDYIKDMESRMYGLTTQDVLTLAYQLAERNNLPHPFSEAKANKLKKITNKQNNDFTLDCTYIDKKNSLSFLSG